MEEKGVATLERALTILASFSEAEPVLSLAEISRRTGLYKSTLLRLLATLERFSYVSQQSDGNYHVGVAALYLGNLYQRSVRPQELITPFLQHLVRKTGESASFNIREGSVRVCVYRVDSPQKIRDHVRVGDVLPLTKGSVGHVLSAFSEDGKDDARWDSMRTDCYSQTHGEIEPDSAAIAAPVFGMDGRCEGALAITGPAMRFLDERMPLMRLLLVQAAAELSVLLGGRSAALEAAVRRLEQALPPGKKSDVASV